MSIYKRRFKKSIRSPLGRLGYVLLLFQPLWRLIELGGDIEFLASNMSGFIGFLSTGWGVLACSVVGIVIIAITVFREPKKINILDYLEYDSQNRPIIEDHTFEGLEVVGPAVFFIINSANLFDRNVFKGAPSSIFIKVQQDLGGGVIGLKNCVFKKCILDKISVIGREELITKLVENIPGVKMEGVDLKLK